MMLFMKKLDLKFWLFFFLWLNFVFLAICKESAAHIYSDGKQIDSTTWDKE